MFVPSYHHTILRSHLPAHLANCFCLRRICRLHCCCYLILKDYRRIKETLMIRLQMFLQVLHISLLFLPSCSCWWLGVNRKTRSSITHITVMMSLMLYGNILYTLSTSSSILAARCFSLNEIRDERARSPGKVGEATRDQVTW